MHPMLRRPARRAVLAVVALALLFGVVALASDTVPTDIKLPGTQPVVDDLGNPLDNPPTISSVGNCGCHGGVNGNPNPDDEPVMGWLGGMMANSGRDPLFWATVAIAEQDFLPGSGGVGDLCIRCHSEKGWLEGRSTPTNGSGLVESTDAEGIMCEFCHFISDPDQANSIPSPAEGSYTEEQNAPFTAYDDTTGAGNYGGAQYVLNSGGTRMGPFDAAADAKHDVIQNSYFRDGRFCGTCHDVSNSAVGDLAHNNGSMTPLDPATFSGIPGDAVENKAAFNNAPHKYGIVERTFSEWLASDIDTLPVNDFTTLPAEMQAGALMNAWEAAMRGACSSTVSQPCNLDANCPTGETCVETTANFEDGTTRYYTCQTCHMQPSGAEAAKQAAFRTDMPRHDLTGGSTWIQDAIQWQDSHSTLVFGSGLTTAQITAMGLAQARAQAMLESAAALSTSQVGDSLRVRVTNLTGHKLITGYPEGRRMWLKVEFYDDLDQEIHVYGDYGPLGVMVQDLDGDTFNVESILDLSSTKVYEAEPAMTKEWADQLLALGYPGSMVLAWDRMTNTATHTLQDLADMEPGSDLHTFHFALNNYMHHDNRIPPMGFDYDIALERNALPVPDDQFGGTGPGSTYNHWDETDFVIPAGAVRADVELYYQSTSWEYIQFLWLQNHGSDDPTPPAGDPFLGQEGVHLLDAWLNTQMAPPVHMATLSTTSFTAPADNPPGGASDGGAPMLVTGYDGGTGALALSYSPACDATGHTVHYGPLASVSSYGWGGADCSLGVSGTDTFVPDPAVGESIFFVLVGHNPSWEGTYGLHSSGIERPPNSLSAGACLKAQSVSTFCE